MEKYFVHEPGMPQRQSASKHGQSLDGWMNGCCNLVLQARILASHTQRPPPPPHTHRYKTYLSDLTGLDGVCFVIVIHVNGSDKVSMSTALAHISMSTALTMYPCQRLR